MSEISKTIQLICDEKGLNYDTVMEAVESAMAAAYRKDFGNRQQNIKVKFDPDTGDMEVWDEKEVSEDIAEADLEAAQEELTSRREVAREEGRELTEEEVKDLVHFNQKTQIMLTEAKEVKKDTKIGDILKIDLELPTDFGRMAAQTAKQVIIQKLREAERNSVFEDFKDQEGQLVHGVIQRRDRGGAVIIDLGKITGIMPTTDQIARENYRPGNRMRFYVHSVEMGPRGPQIILSRAHTKMVEEIFAQEIPEIAGGSVEIKGIARDAGNRSKVAVFTDDDNVDPIGSCIGQRGSRITTIIDELGGEKVDIIQYSDDANQFIQHALSPAKITSVTLNEEDKKAEALVAEDQFSLAIGREGQNVRLASELTGWNITVKQEEGEDKSVDESPEKTDEPEAEVSEEKKDEPEVTEDAPSEEKEEKSTDAQPEAEKKESSK